MSIRFTKMHGLGNDFIVLDAVRQQITPDPATLRRWADRHFGIGCDQILLVEPPRTPDTAFYYRIFNADGSEVEQCGNGARCFARFVREQGLTTDTEIVVGTAAGVIRLFVEADEQVRVNMGQPVLTPAQIPFHAAEMQPEYAVQVADETVQLGAVSMGNPHAVLVVDDIDTAPVARLGPLLERHPRFPQRVNVGFMQILTPEQVRLRVYERGAGETLACGTGACAAVVSGRLRGLLASQVTVTLPGGTLRIEWHGITHPVWMTGPAVSVFQGKID